jgi:hypothetical protein
VEAVEDVVCDAFQRHERGANLVREAVEREGALNIVNTVARLVAVRAPRYGEALHFLSDGLELPVLSSAIETDPDLRSALEGLLTSPSVRDRTSAIWALTMLPIADSSEMLLSAVPVLLTEGDVISLSEILAMVEVPEVVTQVLASDDWLLRWALLPWTNGATSSPLADGVRKHLAADPNALIAREASQHIEIIDAFAKHVASTEGWTFDVLSNHGPAASFRGVTSPFIQQWPVEKVRYTLDELRMFITRETA